MPKAVHVVAPMPLSGPGKIHKVPLCEEAIRATVQGDMDDALGPAHGVVATIVEDARATLAVRLSGAIDPCKRAAAVLERYPFKIVVAR